MLITTITHRGTLKAIKEYGITDEKLQEFNDLVELRKFLKMKCVERWRMQNRDYWIKRYESDESYRAKVLESANSRYIKKESPKKAGRPRKVVAAV